MSERATSSELLELSNEHIRLESSEATSDDAPKLERIEENESNTREEMTSQESNTPASSNNRNQHEHQQQQQQHEHEHEHEQQPINGTLQLARISRNDSMSRSRASLTSHSRSFRALFQTITARSPRSPTLLNGGFAGGRNIALDFFHRTLNTKSFEQIDCHECPGHKNSVVCMKIYPKPAKNTSASESSSVLVSGSRDCDIRVWKMETFIKVNKKKSIQT